MNIAIFSTGYPPDCVGGAEIQAAKVARRLCQKHKVTVFTRSRLRKSEPNNRLCYLICKRTFTNFPIVRFPLDIISSLFCIGRNKGKIDVIIAYQTIIDGLIGVVAKKLFRTPVIVSIRSEGEYKINDFFKSRICAPFVWKNADKVLVQSKRIRKDLLKALSKFRHDTLRKIVEKKVSIIPNGISSRTVGNNKGNKVLYVGRLIKAKGVEYLIAAMKECPEQQLLIVGNGPEKRKLKRIAKNLNNVDFVGQVSPEEVSHFMQQSILLVLPSLRDEGSPNVILEAMAHGIPAIATTNAGIPDILKHGQTGFLTEPGNAKELAYYINKLLSDENLRVELGKNCLKVVQQYSWINVLKLLEDELAQVVAQNKNQ